MLHSNVHFANVFGEQYAMEMWRRPLYGVFAAVLLAVVAFAPWALPRRRVSHPCARRLSPASAPPATLLQRDPLEHVSDGLTCVDGGLERLEDVLPADHDHRVDAAREQ